MGIECPKCHTENPEDSHFCNKCATPLKLKEEETAVYKGTFPAPEKELSVGSVFAGKYKVIEELGRGGMGSVYKAEDTKLKRIVALKFLSPALTRDPEARERFIHEARAVSGMDHPNICTVHEIDETEAGEMYIAMTYYKGESLKDKIKRDPLELEETLDIALQVAGGLEKAHEKGIIHRDVKSANIIVTDDGLAKIVDFGLAKLAGTTRITKVGTTMGTTAYMSPEQARGEEIDHRTDIWSLGVVLYEMVTGKLPFRGEHEQAIVYSILNEQPAPVKDLPKGVPMQLERIMRKALSKDKSKRYFSMKELAQDLLDIRSKWIAGEQLTTRQQIFRRSHKRLWVSGAVGLVVLATVLATWILTRPSLAFQSSDKLLVADVDNQTEDSVFDLALRTAIEADLQQSPYAVIYDKGQVSETLRLMRVDPSARIDESLGYEVCRFAGVRAMILPRILSAGEAYELQAILVDPRRKRYVDRIRVSAKGKEDVLLNAIDKLARMVRTRLGESLESIEKADEPVIEVTTSSWEALQYLTMGYEKRRQGKFSDAAKLFELAIEKDPHFASAKATLGLILIQFLGQKERGQEILRQALQDAGGLPQREHLSIKALNKWFVDEDYESALEEYRIIRELYPDVWTAYNNAGLILRQLGRYKEAVDMFEKAAEIAPESGIPLANLYFTQLSFLKNPIKAEEIARRLVELAPEISYHHHWVGYSLIAQGKFEEALETYKKVLELEPEHPYGFPNTAHLLLVTGAAREAAAKYREFRELISQGRMKGSYPKESLNLAIALIYAGQQEEAKEVTAEGREALIERLKGSQPNAQELLLFGQLEVARGRLSEAESYLQDALHAGIKDPYTTMDLAELYALLGKPELAIITVKKALESGYFDPYFPLLFPTLQSIRNHPEFRSLFNLDSH